jgi:hypothetical protein
MCFAVVFVLEGAFLPGFPGPSEVRLGLEAGLVAVLPAILVAYLYWRRDSLLQNWVTTKTFDSLYRIQSFCGSLLEAAIVFLFIIEIALGYLLSKLIQGIGPFGESSLRVPVASLFTVSFALMLVQAFTLPFAFIFSSRTTAILSFRNFQREAKQGLDKINRKRLDHASKLLEQMLRQYGVQVPHDRLSFSMNLSLLTKQSVDSHVDNFANALENPSNDTLEKAVSSCQDLLKATATAGSIGLRKPFSFWRRLAVPPTMELAANLVYLIVVVVQVLLLILVGIHFF